MQPRWGSDYLAQLIRITGVRYLALNPGASFRGIHDSLVNFLGNQAPSVLLCLHEEHAVAIAQGYAKACGEPMGVFLHSNVGLLHAAMALFNAWCDRVPMLVFGATGPVDAARRRPWIDWIHTVPDQGGLVRAYLKWDDQPASLAAASESVMRANLLTRTRPQAPVYVCFDAAMQEQEFASFPPLPVAERFRPPQAPLPNGQTIRDAASILCAGRKPLILAGRVSRSVEAWRQRVELAEWLGARVLTDLKTAAAFPSNHPLHAGPPGAFLTSPQIAAIQEADVLLDLNWISLAGALGQACPDASHGTLIQVSDDLLLHRASSLDHHGLPAVDLHLCGAPDDVLPALLHEVKRCLGQPRVRHLEPVDAPPAMPSGTTLDNEGFARTIVHSLHGVAHTLARLNIGWPGHVGRISHPMDYLGNDAGGGVGSGLGNVIGTALALHDGPRITVGVLGDGDFMMGNSALWTACHYRIPLLLVIANNRSFYNDELHQEQVALARGRPVANKWIGQSIRDPELDLLGVARAQGAQTFGPVHCPMQLRDAIHAAIAQVRDGRACVIDARVDPGYDEGMQAGMLGRTARACQPPVSSRLNSHS